MLFRLSPYFLMAKVIKSAVISSTFDNCTQIPQIYHVFVVVT